MLDSKFFLTLIGMAIAVIAVYNTPSKSSVNENFEGLQNRSTRVMREVYPAGLQNPHLGYVDGPNYDILSRDIKFVPRSNLSKPPNCNGVAVSYNKSDMTGASNNSYLNMVDMVKNGYDSSKPPEKELEKPKNPNIDTEYPEDKELLPVVDMSHSVGADGTAEAPIIYERHIFANQKSRLRQHGDPIRGDLAIAPIKYGRFDVSVTPHLDLQSGALYAMGGSDNCNTKALAALFAVSAGGHEKANHVGGADMSREYSIVGTGLNGSDIQINTLN